MQISIPHSSSEEHLEKVPALQTPNLFSRKLSFQANRFAEIFKNGKLAKQDYFITFHSVNSHYDSVTFITSFDNVVVTCSLDGVVRYWIVEQQISQVKFIQLNSACIYMWQVEKIDHFLLMNGQIYTQDSFQLKLDPIQCFSNDSVEILIVTRKNEVFVYNQGNGTCIQLECKYVELITSCYVRNGKYYFGFQNGQIVKFSTQNVLIISKTPILAFNLINQQDLSNQLQQMTTQQNFLIIISQDGQMTILEENTFKILKIFFTNLQPSFVTFFSQKIIFCMHKKIKIYTTKYLLRSQYVIQPSFNHPDYSYLIDNQLWVGGSQGQIEIIEL